MVNLQIKEVNNYLNIEFDIIVGYDLCVGNLILVTNSDGWPLLHISLNNDCIIWVGILEKGTWRDLFSPFYIEFDNCIHICINISK